MRARGLAVSAVSSGRVWMHMLPNCSHCSACQQLAPSRIKSKRHSRHEMLAVVSSLLLIVLVVHSTHILLRVHHTTSECHLTCGRCHAVAMPTVTLSRAVASDHKLLLGYQDAWDRHGNRSDPGACVVRDFIDFVWDAMPLLSASTPAPAPRHPICKPGGADSDSESLGHGGDVSDGDITCMLAPRRHSSDELDMAS